ncbi:MAG: UbiA family prenyltransferase [Armatimonadetes bacterium]|nr:UbiA family prenyltransferase [Armatimonadota bacterium]
MATAARGFGALRVYLEMIKIEHSIFALPFAMIGMMWGSRTVEREPHVVYQLPEGATYVPPGYPGSPWPGWPTFLLIVLAMVSCRSAAMAFNRIADRAIDADNPRTKMRALPAGLLQLRHANLFFFGSSAVFVTAAALLNPLSLMLSPVALLVTLGYSLTKRFTPLCHFVLGLSLGIAPAAAWIAVTGTLSWAILPITFAVLFWTAGFDILYALQDVEFDRGHGLRSLPAWVGVHRALLISRMCHIGAVLALALGGVLVGAGLWFYVGVAFAAALLAYEQSLVKPNDLSRINLAFFTLNGYVSLGVFVFALVDVVVGS